jgi:hypothetical protein
VRRVAVTLLALAALAGAGAAPAGAAVTPVDGEWSADGDYNGWPQTVYFTVDDGGRILTYTNGLVGSPIDPCGWAGAWSAAPKVMISGGAFMATQTGAAPVDPTRITVQGRFTSPISATLTFTIACPGATSGPGVRSYTFAATTDAPPPRTCQTARVGDGALELGGAAGFRRHPGRFRGSAAFSIRRRGVDCGELIELMGALLPAKDELTGLGAAGFGVTRVKRQRIRGRRAYRVYARHGRERLSYGRFGSPRIDHSIYRAGQWVDVYGVARYSECTGAFVLKLAYSPYPVGVTAGHCSQNQNLDQPLPVRRGFSGREPTQLGSVIDFSPVNPDASIFSIRAEWGVAQQVERGERPPKTVTGWVRTGDQHNGDRVCLAGRTSGGDVCGEIVPNYPFAAEGQRCTNIISGHGDSGGPIYTDSPGLTTKAIGIASRVGRYVNRGRLCYEPMGRILEHFNATLAPGPLVRGPGIPN